MTQKEIRKMAYKLMKKDVKKQNLWFETLITDDMAEDVLKWEKGEIEAPKWVHDINWTATPEKNDSNWKAQFTMVKVSDFEIIKNHKKKYK